MTALAGANSTIGRAAALVRPTLATPLGSTMINQKKNEPQGP